MFNFITSYPKSGNTWLRFIIFEIYFRDMVSEISSDLVEKYVPDFHKKFNIETRSLVLNPVLKNNEVFIKTHFSFEQMSSMKINKVLLVVRNPLDVIVSLVHYYNIDKNDIDSVVMDFSENHTISRIKEKFKFPGLIEHHDSWINSKNEILILRYEDLVENFNNTIIKLTKFLDKEIDDNKIEKIKLNTSFKIMKDMEKSEKQKKLEGAFRIPNSKKFFMNKGKSNGYFDVLNTDQIEKLRKAFSSFMKTYNY